jgi:hypothetical protein
MDRLAGEVLRSHPVETFLMTVESTIYIALFPLRSPAATLLGISGGSPGWGLMSGAPSADRLRFELRKMLWSPALTSLVVFQMLIGLAMWAGVALALLGYLKAAIGYRIWILDLTLISIVMMVVGAGAEADVRLRAPVVPLLAIVAGLGYSNWVGASKRPIRLLAWVPRLIARRRSPQFEYNCVR